jgi:signal transduction histidine kinase
MHDVLVHYLEVNFPEISEQLAHAHSPEPGPAEREAAAERLRELIRRLRREAAQSADADREAPPATASELIAGVDGELSSEERLVLVHFFDLFARSMQRTQAAITPAPLDTAPTAPPPAVEAVVEPEPAVEAEPVVGAEPASEPERASEPEPAASPSMEPSSTATAVQEPPAAEPVSEAPVLETPAVEPPAREPVLGEAALPGRMVPEQMAGPLQTILLAAAQQALDLLQVDASQVYTVDEQGRFVLRAGVPTESLAAPEGAAPFGSPLLRRVLDLNEVYNVEDLGGENLSVDESGWVETGYRGFAAIPLSPPLEKPVGLLVLLRRTPWRLDRRDALRLEDLAVEVVSALRAHSLAIKVAEVAVLQERLSLAREIHDGLASDLAAVVALFKYYEQRRQRDPEDAGQLLVQLRSMTEEILEGARNILQSLRPRTIRSEGLLASVLKLVDQFGRLNLVETNVNIRGEENIVPAEQKEVIFQVLRETLSNVRKHSQARNLWVVLDLASSPWVLTVRDDGRGFDVRLVAEDPKKAGSYGLVGMRERAELIGASLEVVSQTPEGTVVSLIGPPEREE